MRNKMLIAFVAAAALLMVLLGLLTLRCDQEQYGRLLLVRAGESGAALSAEPVEEFCEKEFLVTYEIKRQATAEAHRYNQPVTLIGTNSCYAQVLGYRMQSGGFFSAAAWRAQAREAVLNTAAAFQIFGGKAVVGQLVKIDGENWIVTGVIEDGDEENARIYAPSSVTGGEIKDIMALLDKNTVNTDYAKNTLKQLGIYENSYTIIDLAAMAAAFGQRFGAAVRAALCLILLLLLRWGAGRMYKRLPVYREQLRELYMRELLAARLTDLVKTALAAIALLAGLAALLTLLLQILAICLKWSDLLPSGHAWAMGGFANKLAWIHDYQIWDLTVFALLLTALALLLPLAWNFPLAEKIARKVADRRDEPDEGGVINGDI